MNWFKKRKPEPPAADASHVTLGPMWHEGAQANVEVIGLFYHHWLQGHMIDGSPMIPVRHKGRVLISPASALSPPREVS